jgi:hypothetical protein
MILCYTEIVSSSILSASITAILDCQYVTTEELNNLSDEERDLIITLNGSEGRTFFESGCGVIKISKKP